MAHLDRDERGYPIPVMVFRDRNGKPHFTINNDYVWLELLRNDQCSICGQKLMRLRWFVGGPLSAFHERGAYLDPPLHRDCMRYAMQTCPYLATPNWSRAIGARTLTDANPNLILIDKTQIPDRPIVFVCVGAIGQTITKHGKLIPNKPYVAVEYWQHGNRVSEPPQQIKRISIQ